MRKKYTADEIKELRNSLVNSYDNFSTVYQDCSSIFSPGGEVFELKDLPEEMSNAICEIGHTLAQVALYQQKKIQPMMKYFLKMNASMKKKNN